MEKLFDFIGKNFVTWLIALFGVFAPGLLTIGIFNRDLFVQLDFLKLISLAGAICLPTTGFLVICTGLILGMEKSIFELHEGYIAGAMCLNSFVFCVALLCKVFYRDMSLKNFVLIILGICIVMFILSLLMHRDDKKDNKKE